MPGSQGQDEITRERELLKRLRAGDDIGAESIAFLVGRFRRGLSTDDYGVVVNVAKSPHADRYEDFFVEVLERYPDAQVRSAGLFALCNCLGLEAKYRDGILQILRGLEWDEDDDCRLRAISAAGDLLRVAPDREIEQALRGILADENTLAGTREAADDALKRAAGWSWNQVLGLKPPPTT